MESVIFYPLLASIILSCDAATECWVDSRHPYFYFGIRTNYGSIANRKGIEKPSGCDPVQIWMVVRNGVSWPFDQTLTRLQTLHRLKEEILANHEDGRGDLCSQDLQELKATQFPPSTAHAGMLTEQGEKDMQELAQTIKALFDNLLEKPYSEEYYNIRYAELPGVEESARAFTSALFGRNFDFAKVRRPAEIDVTLNGPNICDSWREKNFHARFWNLIYMLMMKHSTLRKDLSKRLGFKNMLDFDAVVVMYIGCSLQKAMHPHEHTPWCGIFTVEQLKLLRYMEDSFYYKACGPGEDTRSASLNTVMTCPLYLDLIAQFSKSVKGRHHQNVFYFTDEKTLLLLLNGLGFLEGTQISDLTTAEKRTFRTSSLSPFGANLISVLYKCSTAHTFKVGFYLNGYALKRHGQQEEVETWEDFKKRIDKQYLSNLQCHVDPCPKFISAKSIDDTTFKIFYEF